MLGGSPTSQNSIAEAGGVALAFPFIGINGDGIWAYGQDRTEVEEASLWAVDIRSWQHGYIAWPPNTSKDRKPLAERMVPASSPLPLSRRCRRFPWSYQLQFAFELLCMTGEDAGTMALYKNGRYGAKVIVQTLVEEVRKQAKVDQSKLCPVVELEIRSYFHQEWKKTIYNPVLQIHKWISFEEYDGFEKVGGNPAPQLPARRRRRTERPNPLRHLAPRRVAGTSAAAPRSHRSPPRHRHPGVVPLALSPQPDAVDS